MPIGLVLALACCALAAGQQYGSKPVLSEERVVFQLKEGDIEFAFYPEVAPVTSRHIFSLVQLGLYTSNHFFRVDKGFVAQTADVSSGRQLPMNQQQREHASDTVPLEVQKGVKHHAGRLSMARGSDRHSGSSSFFICLGDAPHLDMEYGVFGEVTKGMEVLRAIEQLPTTKSGIFVMPVERVTILATYWYIPAKPQALSVMGSDLRGEEYEGVSDEEGDGHDTGEYLTEDQHQERVAAKLEKDRDHDAGEYVSDEEHNERAALAAERNRGHDAGEYIPEDEEKGQAAGSKREQRVLRVADGGDLSWRGNKGKAGTCQFELNELRQRFYSQEIALEDLRKQQLP